LLEKLARRVARDAYFLAAPLARFAHGQSLDDRGLAAKVGCNLETLTHLRLCRNPDPAPPSFWNDVHQIATRFGVDPDNLAEIVRLGQSLLKLENAEPDLERGSLIAARDRDHSSSQPEKDDQA